MPTIDKALVSLGGADGTVSMAIRQGELSTLEMFATSGELGFVREDGLRVKEPFDVSGWTGSCIVEFHQTNANSLVPAEMDDDVSILEPLGRPWNPMASRALPVTFADGSNNAENRKGRIAAELPADLFTQPIPVGGSNPRNAERNRVPVALAYFRIVPDNGLDTFIVAWTIKIYGSPYTI